MLQGRLRIGVVPTALPAIPTLALPLARKYPGVSLTVIADPSVDIQAGLDQFHFEAGITYLDNEPLSRVRGIPLYREQYLLVTPAGGPLASKRRVSWKEAASLPLCLLTPDMSGELALLDEIGLAMKDASICGLGQTAYSAVESAIKRLRLFDGSVR